MLFDIEKNFKKSSERKKQKFVRYLSSYRLSRNDIAEVEQKYFSFCKRCARITELNLYEHIFSIPCLCDDARESENKIMREKIKKHKRSVKYEVPRLF